MTTHGWSTQSFPGLPHPPQTLSLGARARTLDPTRRRRYLLRGANILLVLMCLTATAAGAGSAMGFWRADAVLTGSMRPAIHPGDVEVLQQVPTPSLRPGQIVAFHPPHAAFVVSHRVISVHHHHGTWITTKGDANNVADPWGSIRILSPKAWVVVAVVPHAGYLSVWVKSPMIQLFLMIAAVLLVCALAIERIWRR
jgi:signal peptidase I